MDLQQSETDDKQPEQLVIYVCGDCGQENILKRGDVFQCRDCGFRILYKKRILDKKETRIGGVNY
ncbi:unnamed protein product [Arabidopsis thaliana]|uniref:Uncharacterized protein n=1 Tax=Arabidopsis thaliana TaxID=3702 RepID=A0A654EIQ6_ARATH|nr:unnamed protein product [Arabidopsis thaliana]VYS49014.1 unnamed protein product [Arabidopsis thaliana]